MSLVLIGFDEKEHIHRLLVFPLDVDLAELRAASADTSLAIHWVFLVKQFSEGNKKTLGAPNTKSNFSL